MWQVLLYPQFVIGVWGPATVLLLWRATRRWHQALHPRTRFWLAWWVAAFPMLALWVPYLPQLALRHLLPYRVPIAWGAFNGLDIAHEPYWSVFLVALPSYLILVGPILSAAWTATEHLVCWWRVARLPQRRAGALTILDVPGQFAWTQGLLRPRIHLSLDAYHSPHVSAMVAHERAHARALHPLLLALARTMLRALWYLPFSRQVGEELLLTSELWADDEARRITGARAVAQALAASVASRTMPSVGTGFASENAPPLDRARALAAAPLQRAPAPLVAALASAYLLLVVLL